jgi:hypothetical protein
VKLSHRAPVLLVVALAAVAVTAAGALLVPGEDAHAAVFTSTGAKRSFVGVPNQGESTTCLECHTKPVAAGAGSVALSFAPALGANDTYAVDTSYTVTVTVTDNEVVGIDRRSWGFKAAAVWEGNLGIPGPDGFSAIRGKPVTLDKAPKGPVERLYVSHTSAGTKAEPKAGDPTKAATSKRWEFKWQSPKGRPGVANKPVTLYVCGVSGNNDKKSDESAATPGDRTFTATVKLKAP